MVVYWNQDWETMPRETLATFQLERLQWTVQRAGKSPHYSKIFADRGIEPGKIRHLADIRQLPFTTKEDLRSQFPYGLLSVDLKEVVRLHSSSGTTGQATVVFHNQKDIETWADLVSRCM